MLRSQEVLQVEHDGKMFTFNVPVRNRGNHMNQLASRITIRSLDQKNNEEAVPEEEETELSSIDIEDVMIESEIEDLDFLENILKDFDI